MGSKMRRMLVVATGAALVFAGADLAPYQALAASAQPSAANPWAGVTDTGLVDAITAIERATGGRVLEIQFAVRNGTVGYDAVVAKGDEISGMTIAAAPNAKVVVITETDIPEWIAGWRLRADKRSIEKAKLSLAQAVAMAQKMAGGPAVAAGLAKPLSGSNAVLAYNVQVLKGREPMLVAIDAQSGSRIANPDALYDPWDPMRLYQERLKKVAS
jgi:uncharacterized membrane protein YkoI